MVGQKIMIYINIHPTYTYSIAVIQGYVPILKDYVRYVDWLSWDFPNKRQIMISGILQEPGSHLLHKRTQTFIQRMTDIGEEVQIRDNRGDEWRYPEYEKLSDDEMLEIEYENDHTDEIQWAIKDVEKYKELYDFDRNDDTVKQWLDEAERYLQNALDEEERRKREITLIFSYK